MVALTTDSWETVLFGFAYINHLERTAEASMSEIARLDSIRDFLQERHRKDSLRLTEARSVRVSLEEKVELGEGEIKKQKRGKVWGIIGGALSGFGAGAGFGWAISR